MDEFWIYNPYILLKNYSTLLPTNNMTRVEQMNTVTRFMIYVLILLILFDSKNEFLIYIILIIIMIIVVYFIYKMDDTEFKNDLLNENKMETELYENIKCEKCNNSTLKNSIIDIYDNTKDSILKYPLSQYNENQTSPVVTNLESGYIDFDNNYVIGPDHSNVSPIKNNKKISWAKDQIYKENNCRKPTAENPYANILFSDYLDATNLAEPCNIDDNDINNEMQNLYNSSIFRNVSDVFERENSQRIFYTMPITKIPNDQTDFANWLYKTGPTCKENTENCTYYESPAAISPNIN
jgi:hypothetical protein